MNLKDHPLSQRSSVKEIIDNHYKDLGVNLDEKGMKVLQKMLYRAYLYGTEMR